MDISPVLAQAPQSDVFRLLLYNPITWLLVGAICLAWTLSLWGRQRARKHLFVSISATIAGVIILCSLSFSLRSLPQEEVEHLLSRVDPDIATLFADIDDRQAELQASVDPGQLALANHETPADVKAGIAATKSDVAETSRELTSLINEVGGDTGENALQDVKCLRIRLSQATIANVEHRYADALNLLPDEVGVFNSDDTERLIDIRIRINEVRGASYCGLHNWGTALLLYDRVLSMRSGRWRTRVAAGDCLTHLEQYDQAIEHYDRAVRHYERLYKSGAPDSDAMYARCLTKRGTAHRLRGDPDSAIKDLEKAIAIQSELVERQEDLHDPDELANSLVQSGITSSDLDEAQNAIAYYGRAISIFAGLVEKKGRMELSEGFAEALRLRGVALRKQGEFNKAILDFTKAVEVLNALVVQGLLPEFNNGVAKIYNSRALAYLQQQEFGSAIEDFEAALSVRRTLPESAGHDKRVSGLVCSMNNLAWALLTAEPESLRDYRRALGLAKEAVEKTKRSKWVMLDTLALAHHSLGNKDQAIAREEEALLLLKVDTPLRRKVAERLAQYRN